MKEAFYDKQDDLTSAKIDFYQKYIGSYLIKILMGYGRCFIADLFCGPGKSGNEKGSPLVLIDRANYSLTVSQLKNKNSQIHILFNDANKNHISNLNAELKKIKKDKRIVILPPRNKKFKGIHNEIIEGLGNKGIPKFFFLDPFTYSIIKIKDLQKLMNLKKPEILLFLPVFHSYRFASSTKFKANNKARQFIEQYTTKGMCDYKDIHEFMKSIKEKLKQELNLDFVRPVLLDDGKRKNALFLLTKKEEGMLLMNKLCIKKSKDGSGINVRENYESQISLFGKKSILKEALRYKEFKNKLTELLKRQKRITNTEVKKFTIEEEFRPQDAKDILRKLQEKNVIKILDSNNQETRRFYMADTLKDVFTFEYIHTKRSLKKPTKIDSIERKSLLYKSKVDYGGWTINHIVGCKHGCRFPCYAYLMAKRFGWVEDYKDWRKPRLVSNTLDLLEKELKILKNEIDVVHLCFMTDPFMYDLKKQKLIPEIKELTLKIIERLNKADIRVTTLTKGIYPKEILEGKYLKDNEYGITLVSLNDQFKKEFEPFSAPYDKRINSLQEVSRTGKKTWVSMEPYPTPNLDSTAPRIGELLEKIKFVDKIVFGKINYNVKSSNFKKNINFYRSVAKRVINFCRQNKIQYHIKTGTPLSKQDTTKILQEKDRKTN